MQFHIVNHFKLKTATCHAGNQTKIAHTQKKVWLSAFLTDSSDTKEEGLGRVESCNLENVITWRALPPDVAFGHSGRSAYICVSVSQKLLQSFKAQSGTANQ